MARAPATLRCSPAREARSPPAAEAFAFADLEVERVRIGELEVAVVTPRTLYAMKRDTVRPRDADDAARLRRAFRLEEG